MVLDLVDYRFMLAVFQDRFQILWPEVGNTNRQKLAIVFELFKDLPSSYQFLRFARTRSGDERIVQQPEVRYATKLLCRLCDGILDRVQRLTLGKAIQLR